MQAIPPTLQQSLAARLDRLGSARETAQIGAVLGRGFSYALVQSVAGLDELGKRYRDRRWSGLAQADILLVEGDGAQATYRFKHALIQDAAYDGLLKSRRQALHRRAAERPAREERERSRARSDRPSLRRNTTKDQEIQACPGIAVDRNMTASSNAIMAKGNNVGAAAQPQGTGKPQHSLELLQYTYVIIIFLKNLKGCVRTQAAMHTLCIPPTGEVNGKTNFLTHSHMLEI